MPPAAPSPRRRSAPTRRRGRALATYRGTSSPARGSFRAPPTSARRGIARRRRSPPSSVCVRRSMTASFPTQDRDAGVRVEHLHRSTAASRARFHKARTLRGGVDGRLPFAREPAPRLDLLLHVWLRSGLRAATQRRLQQVDDLLCQAAAVAFGRLAERGQQIVLKGCWSRAVPVDSASASTTKVRAMAAPTARARATARVRRRARDRNTSRARRRL